MKYLTFNPGLALTGFWTTRPLKEKKKILLSTRFFEIVCPSGHDKDETNQMWLIKSILFTVDSFF